MVISTVSEKALNLTHYPFNKSCKHTRNRRVFMKIMFNGVRLNTSPTETRQVPPLQQYLFNIVLEAVALTITPKKEMKAIKN